MKIFSAAKGKALDRTSARACAGVNLFATPGLGTILAGRWISGVLEMILAIAGFALITKYQLHKINALLEGTSSAGQAWMWRWGAVFFAASWLSALRSSLSILRGAKSSLPPKLDGTEG